MTGYAKRSDAMTPADLIAKHKGFTPGPWETDSRIPTRVTGPNDRGICSTGGYQTNTVDVEILNAESEANAALIADAPALLELAQRQARRIAVLEEALESLTAACESDFGTDDDDDEAVAYPETALKFGHIRKARAALEEKP